MKQQPRAFQAPKPIESNADTDTDDEEFPATRFFTDAMARKMAAPVRRPRRNIKLIAIGAGLVLALIALAALAAWLNS